MADNYLNAEGLQKLVGYLVSKKQLNNTISVKTTSEWLQDTTYIPPEDLVLVFSDCDSTQVANSTLNTPSVKVGDGIHTVSELPFINSGSVTKLRHSIKIGDATFDGTSDVTINTYTGEIASDDLDDANTLQMNVLSVDNGTPMKNITDGEQESSSSILQMQTVQEQLQMQTT